MILRIEIDLEKVAGGALLGQALDAERILANLEWSKGASVALRVESADKVGRACMAGEFVDSVCGRNEVALAILAGLHANNLDHLYDTIMKKDMVQIAFEQADDFIKESEK